MTVTELLQNLVRRPSINPMGRTDIPSDLAHESRVTAYLEGQLKSLGVECHRQPVAAGRDNLIAFYRTDSPITYLWEAHQDTVPVDGMTVEPFAAVLRDGKLFGRGACDVKAGIACMLAAFARLVREKPVGSANVILAFTVDEEHTFLGVQELMKANLTADFAVVAEPTLLNVVTTHKGVVRWQLETGGRACHSSRPDEGVSAVYRMAKVVAAVEEYAEKLRTSRSHPRLGSPTLSVGMIAGGVSPNTVPDQCVIQLDRRLLPGEDAQAAIDDLSAFLAARDFGFSIATKRHFACPALSPTADDHPHLQRFAKAIGPHEKLAVPYGTDASSISPTIPAVVFGPGDIAQAHTKDEWVELAQVERAADILFRFAAFP
ncbi:M20 family metallopeptidase [Limnoglobus roseus]|uniref:Acetylornithine deacetylase n=1 Tax=Limnoglobus roseus TaxID=2598579 RepID=A0A5C1A9I0_9BACT|nr:M20 family metallopeptidase [Limnoglobus roseus]QEL14706.1 acetylornithine deacetylase [Limnoglobus roseus]